jgi:PKHD-type hydroxylase
MNSQLSHRVSLHGNVMVPYAYAEAVFNQQELAAIIKMTNSMQLKTGTIAQRKNDKLSTSINEKVRTSKTTFFSLDASNRWIFEKLDEVLLAMNNEYFQMNVWGYDEIQYSEYREEDSGEYRWHMDTNISPKNLESSGGMRKLSMSLLLNDDFEGGDFQMNLSSEKKPSTIEMSAGTLILFPSFLMHRVTPVTKNTRKSLVLWLLGNKFT